MVLVMTGTIDSGYFGNASTRVSDTETRLGQYTTTIERYLRESRFDRILFAENSRYPFDAEPFRKLAASLGKRFEYLPVATDAEKTKKLGKSYGEADLIDAAVAYLGESETVFYKVTGRVYVENINRLISDRSENEFICHNNYESLLTVFFKMRTDTFRRCLRDAGDDCDEYDGWRFIEHIYYLRLKNERIRRLRRYPALHGVVGMNGNPYDRSKAQMFIKNLLLLLGYYNYGTSVPLGFRALEKLETTVSRLLK